MFRVFPTLSLTAVILLSGCGKSPEPGQSVSATPAQNTNQQIFQVKGVVVEVTPEKKSVTIKHEAVPNYMPAMTMPFDVRDTNELTGLEAGNSVSFRMIVTDTDGWIDHIVKTGTATNTLPEGLHRVRDVEPLNEGDLLPEYQFINQFGKVFNTADFKGKALAITFLFTRCPFPTFCPFLSNSFGDTQKKLLAMNNAPTNWHLLAISFDPEFDTPDVLKNYGEIHRYDPTHWTLATGELIDITALGEQLGLAFWHDESGSISHNLRTAVIDSSGHIQKIFIGNEWTADDLVAEIIKAAAKK
jgi:protein SCO1/2